MEVIRRSQAGDQASFAALFEQYKNLVFKTAYLMLGDAPEAEDALQEVMWQVYRSLHTYDPQRGAFTTWLHRLTVNHCLNRQRSGSRVSAVSIDHATGYASPEVLVEIDDSLRYMLQGLSDKHRAVVVLRYVWDLSYEEIAAILDVPLGTVQSRLHVALKQVRERMSASQSRRGGAGR